MSSSGVRYVVLLRGVNVGGHGKLPMALLREVCTTLGCTDVQTYIQSGNAVLTAPVTAQQLAAALPPAIAAEVGFAPAVVVRTAAEVAGVVADHPFLGEEEILHVGFLSAVPDPARAEQLRGSWEGDERLVIVGRQLYLRLPAGLGRSRLGAVPFARKLGVDVTLRNWRTVLKLDAIAASPGVA